MEKPGTVVDEKNGQRRLPVWKKLLFSFFPLLALIAAAEIYLRCHPVYPNLNGRTRAGYVVSDEKLTWRLAPVKTGNRATNSLGFRDAPYKADADVKILLLGDSISWGDRMWNTKAIYPQFCERLLSKETGREFEIVNTGTPGYCGYQEALLLKELMPKIKPDMVVLQFCLNDVVDRYRTMAAFGGDDVFLGVDTREACRGFTSLSRYSRIIETIVRFKQRQGRNYEEFQVKNLMKEPLSPELEEAWATTFKDISDIKASCDNAGIPMLLLISPFAFQLGDPERLGQPQKRLKAFAEKNGIDCLDLLPLFAAHQNEKLFADANHFAGRGHELAAAALKKMLLQCFKQGVLDCDSNPFESTRNKAFEGAGKVGTPKLEAQNLK
ncbi:MAG: SGNH/GDSL hydrolase family protein [Victivallales bacterium]|nr:SGNH/GDSL hydrolase family protein [Victivallales bacterium]